MRGKIDKRIVANAHTTRHGKSSLARHGIKHKRGRKIHAINTNAEKSNASTTRKIELQWQRKINTQNTHVENRLWQITRKVVKNIWMEKLFLTYGKTFSIYRHRNNCGENVCGKIVACPRKNARIVVVNEHTQRKNWSWSSCGKRRGNTLPPKTIGGYPIVLKRRG